MATCPATAAAASRPPVSPAASNAAGAPYPSRKPLLTRTEAAAYLGISPQTLAADVSTQRMGMPMVKLGRRCMYRLQDLEAYCAAHVTGGISDSEAK